MLTAAQITTFNDAEAPPGQTVWVDGAAPLTDVEVVSADPGRPAVYGQLATRIRSALGDRVLALDHVGSTSVPGLAAKPIIDIDLTVADSGEESVYIPALESVGFLHVVREPWW